MDSQFKDFVVSEHVCTVNEKLKDVDTVSKLATDNMHINGELKILGFDRVGKEGHVHGMYVELPTGDDIFVSASDHPWVETSDGQNSPVFMEDENKSELKWHKDLSPGDFYIMHNKFGKTVILIKWIHDDTIEYVECNAEYIKNNLKYYVKETTRELKLGYAEGYKFVSVNDIK